MFILDLPTLFFIPWKIKEEALGEEFSLSFLFSFDLMLYISMQFVNSGVFE